MIYDGDTIEKEGRTFRVNIERDNDHGAPWEESDGHGIVSDWTSRAKRAGERILSQDRSSYRFYDIAETMKIAKNDWGLCDEEKGKLAARLGRAPTIKEITAEAVERDFEHLRRWCADLWHWCGVIVTDITDDPDAPIDYGHALWGIEDSENEYLEEVAHELIDDILHEVAKVAAAAQKEHDEVAYWAARGVMTWPQPAIDMGAWRL